jgi:hypothetical protein
MLSAKCMSMKVSVSDVVMPDVNGCKSTGNERLLLQELRSASKGGAMTTPKCVEAPEIYARSSACAAGFSMQDVPRLPSSPARGTVVGLTASEPRQVPDRFSGPLAGTGTIPFGSPLGRCYGNSNRQIAGAH